MSKPTPGPWSVEIGTIGGPMIIGGGQPSIIAKVMTWGGVRIGGELDEITEANARLIAAAPELLDALEAAEELHRIGLFNAADGQIQRVNELRSAAIAKATGA